MKKKLNFISKNILLKKIENIFGNSENFLFKSINFPYFFDKNCIIIIETVLLINKYSAYLIVFYFILRGRNFFNSVFYSFFFIFVLIL